MLQTIAIIVAVFSFLFMIFIVLRNFSRISMINVSSHQKEKTKKVRDKILEDRVKRKLEGAKKRLFDFFVLSKETETEAEISPVKKEDTKQPDKEKEKELKEDYKEDVLGGLLEKALENFEEKNYQEAEDDYIGALSLDEKNIQAFLGLADIYLATSEDKKFKETCDYILATDKDNLKVREKMILFYKEKEETEVENSIYEEVLNISPDNHRYLFDYAQFLDSQGEDKKSLEVVEKALTLSNYDSKYLEFAFDLYVKNKKKVLAKQILSKIKETDPDNKKIDDLKNKLSDI